jgi:hypothetical protein
MKDVKCPICRENISESSYKKNIIYLDFEFLNTLDTFEEKIEYLKTVIFIHESGTITVKYMGETRIETGSVPYDRFQQYINNKLDNSKTKFKYK